jgi:hypothetical protein
MNIKSLILGSAAALVAVSGARAADAVMMPEPEPVEYVRVCDAYGAGFFYIPGTETCLQISGYVWYQIAAEGFDGIEVLDTTTPDPDDFFVVSDDTPSYHLGQATDEGFYKSVRARVNFDARSETEWGTLRAYIRFQASWNGVGDGAVAADQAYIQLGGLMMGYSESFWVDSKNGGPSNYGSHSWTGLYYGYQQRALIGYRFESGAFSGAISLEDDALEGEGYMPDIVAKLAYSGGWGGVWARVGYDESFDDGGFGAQLGAQINMPNMPGSSFRILGFYADGDHDYGSGSPLGVNSEWSILASYNQQFSETLGASVGFQYFNDFYVAGTDLSTGDDGYAAELSVVWFPVSQFEVRTEVGYTKVEDLDGTLSGFLRFTRYF